MNIKDRVYGNIIIDEPVILELIASGPVQRLRKINQAGASQYVIPTKTVTRYEHSIGVMTLLKKLGASPEEQIAGLLHDTPHTAFSHVIDFVFKSDKHDFHEGFYEKIIVNSEIPKILHKYGFNIERLLEETNYPLLEKELPDLCADRVDYALRDMVSQYGYHEKVSEYLRHFIVRENEIIIDDKSIGKDFAMDYLKMDETIWSNPFEVALFEILARAIRIALDRDILSEEDLFRDDLFVYEKLKNSNNKDILKYLNMLSPDLKIEYNPLDFDFHSVNKLRFINPKCLNGKTIKPVTEWYPDFIEILDKHEKWIKEGNFVKIISS